MPLDPSRRKLLPSYSRQRPWVPMKSSRSVDRVRPRERSDLDVAIDNGRRVRPRIESSSPVEPVEVQPKDLLPGVSPDDLPIYPSSKHRGFAHYKDLPVLRHLEWHVSENTGEPIRRDLRDNGSLLAAFAQTRGYEPPSPCDSCRRSRGPWKTCVIGTDTLIDSPTHGSCANCRFIRRGHTCSIQMYQGDNHAVGDPLHAMIPQTDGEANESPDVLATPVSSMPQRQPERTAETEEPPKRTRRRRSNENNTSQNEPPVKDEPNPDTNTSTTALNSPANASRSQLEGKVVPFPLGPETFDDLPLLRKAAKDLIKHIDRINRRIEQLEAEERDGREVINPWELV